MTETGAAGVALAVGDLCKSYKKKSLANDHITLTLERGEVFGLLGPNGAGKTTLVNQIIGLVRPDSGSIVVDGRDVVSDPGYARQACSFQAQTQVPINGLTAKQAIELVGRVRGAGRAEVRARAGQLLEALDMQEWSGKLADAFSGGMRRLVAFCMAAVTPGKIVILDEPTNDIDPMRRKLLWDQVRDLVNMGSTVLLVTHNVLEAERAVDRLAIIDKGRMLATGTPASLKGDSRNQMRLEIVLEPGATPPTLLPLLSGSVNTGRRIMTRVREADVAAATQWAGRLKERGVVEEYSVGPITLEDVYLSVVGAQEEEPSGTPEVTS